MKKINISVAASAQFLRQQAALYGAAGKNNSRDVFGRPCPTIVVQ
jgi:hypothetical protein